MNEKNPSSTERMSQLDQFLSEQRPFNNENTPKPSKISPKLKLNSSKLEINPAIVVVADVHAGLNFNFRINPDTGIGDRALDFHKNLVKATQFAINNQSKLFVILGDLFERTHVAPTNREWIRRDIIEPLGEANIETWLIAGNHDQPKSSARATSLQDFRGYPHVNVYTKPAEEHIEIDGKTIGVLIVPYIHPEQILKSMKNTPSQPTSLEQQYRIGQVLLQKQLIKKANAIKTDFKMLFAHFYIEGAKLRATRYPMVLPHEFQFNREMIPNNLDLAIFGHVHLHQVVGKRGSTEIIYPGSIERIDWGEKDDKKGFLAISPFTQKKWQFIELPTRDMIHIPIHLPTGIEDPTSIILSKIPQDPIDKMIRLDIQVGDGVRQRIQEIRIEEKLRKAFHYETRITNLHSDKIAPISHTMDPFKLFVEFVELNYPKHLKKDQILQIGKQIIEEALQ